MNETESTSDHVDEAPNWQALDSLQRRVLGVLVEKAKTTPDAYPLTVNSIKTACNQKSNRNPKMDLAADDILATLDELREMGAVAELQGDGRAVKFRHRAYDWLGVSKVEMAVVAELLLRGEQTVGELRGRAARMEPIDGLSELKPIMAGLIQKKLVVEVTPAGRGQIVNHGLYIKGEQPAQAPPRAVASGKPAGSTGSSTSSAPSDSGLLKRIEALEQRVAELESRPAQTE